MLGSFVRDLAVVFRPLLATVARLAGPDGARAVVAESVLVTQQLLILWVANCKFLSISCGVAIWLGRTLSASASDRRPTAGPGGARAVVAESVLVKQQLLLLSRSRKRSPVIRTSFVLP